MDVPLQRGPGAEPLTGVTVKEIVQIVHVGKVFCASHVVPKRRDGYSLLGLPAMRLPARR